MVKLTVLGRLSDGMPLAMSSLNGDDDVDDNVLQPYTQQAELLLKQIADGAIAYTEATIRVDDNHCFQYMVSNGVCYVTLTESSYPRKLAFYYLRDLQKELEQVDAKAVLESLSKPYALKRFAYVIGKVRKRYLDTRTVSNLSKLNSNRTNDLNVFVEEISKIINKNLIQGGFDAKICSQRPEHISWNSKLLEDIALKYMPFTILGLFLHYSFGQALA